MEYEVDKWDMEDFVDKPLNKKNKKDVRMAREYCDEHERMYSDTTCEPTWKRGGDLDIYVVTLHKNKTAKLKFIKERNKK